MNTYEVNFKVNGTLYSRQYKAETWGACLRQIHKQYPQTSHSIEIIGWRLPLALQEVGENV